jgi:hypothetical protein
MNIFPKKIISIGFIMAAFVVFILPLSMCVHPSVAQASDADSPLQLAKDVVNAGFNAATKVSSALTANSTTALATKGYILDPLAFAASKAVLNSVVQSTVKWINSGFSGSPAFATNLNSTLLSVSNSAADSFVQQLTSNGSINSPFQNQVATAVAANYNTNTNGGFFAANPYTLNQASPNPTAFLAGNFSQGGLDAWFSAVTNPSNNAYGAYEIANSALNSQVANAQSNQKTELNWGKGFMSYKGNCNSATTKTSTGGTATSLSGNTTCALASILTPGAAIESQLEKSLGSGVDQLVTANQFNEIVNALVGQLTKQVLGSGGLSGLSQPSSSGGSSYLDQITSTQAAANTSLSASFSQTVSTQITQLQQFQSEWATINSAAQAAEAALAGTTSACFPNAQQTITTTVQPVIVQAATELSDANTSINSLNTILSEANSGVSTNSTTGITQASADYSTLLSSPSLPSAADIQNAITQSTDTGTSTTSPSLYSQMVLIKDAVASCQPSLAPNQT